MMEYFSLENTIEYLTRILRRELTAEEILIIGVAYQNGILRGLQEIQDKL